MNENTETISSNCIPPTIVLNLGKGTVTDAACESSEKIQEHLEETGEKLEVNSNSCIPPSIDVVLGTGIVKDAACERSSEKVQEHLEEADKTKANGGKNKGSDRHKHTKPVSFAPSLKTETVLEEEQRTSIHVCSQAESVYPVGVYPTNGAKIETPDIEQKDAEPVNDELATVVTLAPRVSSVEVSPQPSAYITCRSPVKEAENGTPDIEKADDTEHVEWEKTAPVKQVTLSSTTSTAEVSSFRFGSGADTAYPICSTPYKSKTLEIEKNDSEHVNEELGKTVSVKQVTFTQTLSSVQVSPYLSCSETDTTFQRCSPSAEDGQGDDDGSSDDSAVLHIVLPANERKRKRAKSLDKELEEDIKNELEKKSKKTCLTLKKVKSIMRYVIGNESILAMVSNSMRDAGADPEMEPKLTRAKTRLLREENQILWPLSPINPAEPADNEHLVLIREELPEEEDDDEYKPTVEDLQDHSESGDESGRQSVGTPSLDVSAASRYLENFDPGLLDDVVADSQNCPTSSTMSKPSFGFKQPAENIGQRTRSKFSLSSTPLEAIEQAFVPPDITTDMYDFKCDNQEWENFLKEFMLPLSNDTADADEEDDPEYSAMAEEEELDKEELRRDRGVTVTRAELKTLVMELVGDFGDQSSDDEAPSSVRPPSCAPSSVGPASVGPQYLDPDPKFASKDPVTPQEDSPTPSPSPPCTPSPPPEPVVIGMTRSQHQLLMQQIRQHVQLLAQHFLQTHLHPLYAKNAVACKIMLAQFVEMAKLNPNSVINVFNMQKALTLVEDWERFLMTEEGLSVIKYVEQEVKQTLDAKNKKALYRSSFHPTWMRFVAASQVFMYPSLLPLQPFRSDPPARIEFAEAEDQLIALGLEQTIPYLKQYPRWCDQGQGPERAASGLIHEILIPNRTAKQILARIRHMRVVEGNPIWVYDKFKKAPRTMHFVIPFTYTAVLPPKNQRIELLNGPWRLYVEHITECNTPNCGKCGFDTERAIGYVGKTKIKVRDKGNDM